MPTTLYAKKLVKQVQMKPLAEVLKKNAGQNYTFQQYPGMAILRLDRSTFWVHDVKSQLGVVVDGWQIAKEVLIQLAQDF